MNKILLGLLIMAGSMTVTNADNEFNKGLLWKVDGNGLESPSYIFGTLHVICTSDFFVFEGISDKLAESNHLVLELDLNDPAVFFILLREALMENDTRLEDLVSTEEYELIETFLVDSFAMDIENISRFQPYFIITMLYPHMLGCVTKSYEQFFLNQANQLEMKLTGLETLEEQLHVFEVLSYNEQAALLLEFLNNFDDKRKEFQHMLRLYLAQDIGGLWQTILASQTDNEEFNRRLLYDRNHRWVSRITNIMREGPTFFAVGAGHLPGNHGILRLLVEEGFTVERVLD